MQINDFKGKHDSLPFCRCIEDPLAFYMDVEGYQDLQNIRASGDFDVQTILRNKFYTIHQILYKRPRTFS